MPTVNVNGLDHHPLIVSPLMLDASWAAASSTQST